MSIQFHSVYSLIKHELLKVFADIRMNAVQSLQTVGSRRCLVRPPCTAAWLSYNTWHGALSKLPIVYKLWIVKHFEKHDVKISLWLFFYHCKALLIPHHPLFSGFLNCRHVCNVVEFGGTRLDERHAVQSTAFRTPSSAGRVRSFPWSWHTIFPIPFSVIAIG
jgi:hypothetical protein